MNVKMVTWLNIVALWLKKPVLGGRKEIEILDKMKPVPSGLSLPVEISILNAKLREGVIRKREVNFTIKLQLFRRL